MELKGAVCRKLSVAQHQSNINPTIKHAGLKLESIEIALTGQTTPALKNTSA